MKTHPSDQAFGYPDRDRRPTAAGGVWAGPRYPTQLAEPESVNA
jgi:hypothetical protein